MIMRQLSNRNQRYNVKYRLRHLVQICLLLAICIWLVYQVKHSDENRRAFVDRKEDEEQSFLFRFGRKGIINDQENELMRNTRSVGEVDVVNRDDEAQEQELMNDDVKNEGNGDADDWIDEQDHDQQGQEKELELEFKNEDKNETYMGKADLFDSFVRENSVLHAMEVKNKRDVAGSVTLETHMNEAEAGLVDARGLDVKKLDDMDANLEGSSSDTALDVSDEIIVHSMRI